jgi:type IV pilus assembly protein PilE
MKLDKRAFTLIELLVVVLIIGILAAIALPQYQIAVLKSRFSDAIINIKAVKEAEEIYFLTNGGYTSDPNLLDVKITQPKGFNSLVINTSENRLYYFYSTGLGGIGAYLNYRDTNDSHLLKNAIYCYAASNTRENKVCKTLGTLFSTAGYNRYSL